MKKTILKVQKWNEALKHTNNLAYLGTMNIDATAVFQFNKIYFKRI